MTSFVSIAAIAIVAICITHITATPHPQVVTTPPLPTQPQQASTTDGLGENIGKYVDQMVQRGKDTIQKFIPQGTKGVAMQGVPQGSLPSPPTGMGVPLPSVGPLGALPGSSMQPGFVGDKVAAHGFAGHFHNAACRNATN